MRAREAIRMILEEQGRSQRSLALDLEVTPQALDQRLRAGTMKVETLSEMAGRLGYRLVLEPSGNEPRGIEIDG